MSKTIQNIVINDQLKLNPYYEDHYICLALSSNNDFIKYTSVLIKSIIDNSKSNHNYDIIILHTDISEDNMNTLEAMIIEKNNFSIRFVNIRYYVNGKQYYIKTKDKRLTEETYYRIYLPDILSDKYNKVIYLDGDMVTRRDIYELVFIDIENIYIAAVRDFLGIAICYKKAIYGEERRNNRLNIVKINNINDYFIAGLLIINLKELRKSYNSTEIEQIAMERPWLQHDQDVLNYICRNNKVKFIDPKWNVLHDYGDIKYLPQQLLAQYRESEKDPYIVHYGGSKKPWKNETSREIYFWHYAIKSPFIDEIIDNNPLYLLDRETIDYDFFVNHKIDETEEKELIKEYILFTLNNESYTKYNHQNENKQTKNNLFKPIETIIKLYKKYSSYINEDNRSIYIFDIYNKIKIYRKHVVTHHINLFTSSREITHDICCFLIENKETICKQNRIGYIGMLEYALISKGTNLSWTISMFPHFYYKFKEFLVTSLKTQNKE